MPEAKAKAKTEAKTDLQRQKPTLPCVGERKLLQKPTLPHVHEKQLPKELWILQEIIKKGIFACSACIDGNISLYGSLLLPVCYLCELYGNRVGLMLLPM